MFFKRCESSEFLLGIQKYSLSQGERKKKEKKKEQRDGVVEGGKQDKQPTWGGTFTDESMYSSVARKFEKIKKLEHPNVCRYLNINRSNNDYIIFSEYYSLSLHDILREQQTNYANFNCIRRLLGIKKRSSTDCSSIDSDRSDRRSKIIMNCYVLRKVIYELFNAMQYLHSKGITLLNINTKNILITPKGKIKLHNYCMAYLFDDCSSDPHCKKNFFTYKLMEQMVASKKYEDLLVGIQSEDSPSPNMDHGYLASYNCMKGEEDNREKSSTASRKKGRNNPHKEKSSPSYISSADFLLGFPNFANDLLFYAPAFIFQSLALREKKYNVCDIYKQIDLFNAGVVITQLVNGLLTFTSIVKNLSDLFRSSEVGIFTASRLQDEMDKKEGKKEVGRISSNTPMFCEEVRSLPASEPRLSHGKSERGEKSVRNSADRSRGGRGGHRRWRKKVKGTIEALQTFIELVIEGEEKEKFSDGMTAIEMSEERKNEREVRPILFFIPSFAKEKENVINKVENIFTFLLYMKMYYVYMYHYRGKKKDVSLLNINVNSVFKKICKKEKRQGNYNKKLLYTSYEIVRCSIQYITSQKINVHFIKLVEEIFSEFFTLHIVKHNLKNIFPPSKENDNILFLNLLNKCFMLNLGKNTPHSMLSHYFFFHYANVLGHNTKEEFLPRVIPLTGGTLQTEDTPNVINSHGSVISTKETLTGKEENPYFEIVKRCNNKPRYFNPFIADYLLNTKKDAQHYSKHFIYKKDVYYWFDLLYKMNYEEELKKNRTFFRPCNLLRVPYLLYKRKGTYRDISLLFFYKLNLMRKYRHTFCAYEYVGRFRNGSGRRTRRRTTRRRTTRTTSSSTTTRRTTRTTRTTRRTAKWTEESPFFRIKRTSGKTILYEESKCTKLYKLRRERKLTPFIEHPHLVSQPRCECSMKKRSREKKIKRVNNTFMVGNNAGKCSCTMGKSNFFDTPLGQQNGIITQFNGNNVNTVGIYLTHFFDVLNDAYTFVKRNGYFSYEETKNEHCIYEKESHFLYQYSMHIKFQHLLKYDSVNSIKIIRAIKNGFPSYLRNVVYLILLNCNYNVVINKSLEKKEKMKILIWLIFCKRKNQQKDDIPLRMKQHTDRCKFLHGKCSNVIVSHMYEKGINNLIRIKQNREITCLHKFLKKKCQGSNDLIGSCKFEKKLYTLLLFVRYKLKIKNKYIKHLLIPITLLYYNNLYLGYKCAKKIIEIYLLDLYKNTKSFNELYYIFNSLLTFYDPELSLYFFKNNISIVNLIKGWIYSLFSNFFDIQNVYFIFDIILIQPRFYLLFLCLTILMCIKTHLMNINKYNFYKSAFSLSSLINLNLIIKKSIHLFKTYPIIYTTFSITNVHQDNNDHCKNGRIKWGHINYLSYLIGRNGWTKYYIHRNTFKIYKRVKCTQKGTIEMDQTGISTVAVGAVAVSAVEANGAAANGAAANTSVKCSPPNGDFLCKDADEDGKHSPQIDSSSSLTNFVLNENYNSKKLTTLKWNCEMCKHKIDNIKKKGTLPPSNDNLDEKKKKKKKRKIKLLMKWKHYYEYFLNYYKINEKKYLDEFFYKDVHLYNKYTCKWNGQRQGDDDQALQRNKYSCECICALRCQCCSHRIPIYHKITNRKKKRKFKCGNLVQLIAFPMFPFSCTTNMSGEYWLDKHILVDMRSPEVFEKKRLKSSVHINIFLTNFKNGMYSNYVDDCYDINVYKNVNCSFNPAHALKTIVLIFENSLFDFDVIYNFLNLKITRVTILRGGFEYALRNFPSSDFTSK
ncbi:Rab GTPase activator and protein kinase, putative [Plasmodium ovale wallikeri]|uniref:Rab GTPase activator and protein kinase, putative n=1 Tax=Plasmodium ovale wallikeri TaxID=864142 RepID=A0A1A8YIQ7_PLAOA|nr:Rab GTPase activator and protein kinase, putative [Plasmodium ovale wallikeri]